MYPRGKLMPMTTSGDKSHLDFKQKRKDVQNNLKLIIIVQNIYTS